MAAMAGVSPAYVGQLEYGYRPKRGGTVERIEEILAQLEREQ
jgi:hypothetical protein